MKPLSETNPYIRDPEDATPLLERNARQSSVFEGARGLTDSRASRLLRTKTKRLPTAPAKKSLKVA